MPQKTVRTVAVLAIVVMMAALIPQAASEWLLRQPDSARLPQVLSWFPFRADLWRRSARGRVLSLQDSELRRSAEEYRQALQRNPLDALAWEGLAGIESRLEGGSREESVLRSWITSIPHSPRASWALANLLLRNGRTQVSFPYFRQAALDNAELRPALFELSWKVLDDPDQILNDLIPDDESARIGYLYFLAGSDGKLTEALAVWRDLQVRHSPGTGPTGMFLAEKLAAAGMGPEAAGVWKVVRPATTPAIPGELVENGDFEAPLVNAGLEWRLTPDTGFQFSLDDFQAASGSRSLRISFDGTGNPELTGAQQWVIVQPNTEYHFAGSVRTEELTTENGIFLSLFNPADHSPAAAEMATKALTGTNPWTHFTLDFRTDDKTHVLLLRVRRHTSPDVSRMLAGKVWIDAVSLQPRDKH